MPNSKFLLFVFSFTFLAVGVYSCVEDKEPISSNQSLQSERENLIVGDLHNYLIDLWSKNIQECPNNVELYSLELKEILLLNSEIISQTWNFDKNEFVKIVNQVDFAKIVSERNNEDYFTDQIQNSNLSNQFKQTISEFNNNIIPLINDENVEQSNLIILSFYQNKINQFMGEEKMLFEYLIDVALKSNVLWKSTNKGGLNMKTTIDEMKFRLCRVNNSARWDLWKVVKTDCVSGVAGALGNLVSSGGAGAIPNPMFGGCPTAGVVAVIAGAAGSINAANN